MKYIRIFKEHSLYEENKGTLEYPSLSYCEKENEVHYMPSNSVMFYVGDLSGKTDQTVVINYSGGTSDTVSIQEPNKWYTHNIPSGNTLSSVTNLDYIKEAVVNCDEAYAQNWKKVDKVSYYNCDILGGKFGYEYGYNNVGVTSLDIRTVDTSNVTDISYMFYGCSGLKSLDVSSFDTSNVTYMGNMFDSCSNLTSLDLSNFNTSNVTDMSYMFYSCSSLTSLDLSGWDTSNVTSMCSMFNYCNRLTSLDVSNFNTSNVTDMSSMFWNCTSITSLDLSGWDMTNVTNTSDMFYGCNKLTTIRMIGCNQDTINKIKAVKPSSATIITE